MSVVFEAARSAIKCRYHQSMRRLARAEQLIGFLASHSAEQSADTAFATVSQAVSLECVHADLLAFCGRVHDGQWHFRVDRECDAANGAMWAFDCIERVFASPDSSCRLTAVDGLRMLLSCMASSKEISDAVKAAYSSPKRKRTAGESVCDVWQALVSSVEWQKFSLFYRDLRDAELK